GPGAGRIERGLIHLIVPVHGRREQNSAIARQLGCAAKFADSHDQRSFIYCCNAAKWRAGVNPSIAGRSGDPTGSCSTSAPEPDIGSRWGKSYLNKSARRHDPSAEWI